MGKYRQRKKKLPTGILLIDKPVGPSSRWVVEAVEERLGLRGLGHCGTLDPLASGLLIFVSGAANRLQERLTGHDKVYRASIRLGIDSASDDGEGPLSAREPAPLMPSLEEVRAALDHSVGEIEQRAPRHSAIKVGGQRLYELARMGEEVEPPLRRVRIDKIEILKYEPPNLAVEVSSGPGTYIRSMARDLGERLGTGAYLSSLRRLRSGFFELSEAIPYDEVGLDDLRPLEDALHAFPRIDLRPEDWSEFINGRPLALAEGATVAEDSLIWLRGRIVGRAQALSDSRFRLKRLIYDPFEESSRYATGSGKMSEPSQGE